STEDEKRKSMMFPVFFLCVLRVSVANPLFRFQRCMFPPSHAPSDPLPADLRESERGRANVGRLYARPRGKSSQRKFSRRQRLQPQSRSRRSIPLPSFRALSPPHTRVVAPGTAS